MSEHIKAAIFPALLDPAKEAASAILQGRCTQCEVEGQEGFWVARQSASEGLHIAHSFEHEGEQFVIFEKVTN